MLLCAWALARHWWCSGREVWVEPESQFTILLSRALAASVDSASEPTTHKADRQPN